MIATPFKDVSNTKLLQVIAGDLVQRSGFNVKWPSESKTELLQVIAGALVDPNTMETIHQPVGGHEPPIGGQETPVVGGLVVMVMLLLGRLKRKLVKILDY